MPIITDTVTPFTDDMMTLASTAAFFGGIIDNLVIDPYMSWVESWQFDSGMYDEKSSSETEKTRYHQIFTMSLSKKFKTRTSIEKLRLSWSFSLASEKFMKRGVGNSQCSSAKHLGRKRLGYFLDEMMWLKQSVVF